MSKNRIPKGTELLNFCKKCGKAIAVVKERAWGDHTTAAPYVVNCLCNFHQLHVNPNAEKSPYPKRYKI